MKGIPTAGSMKQWGVVIGLAMAFVLLLAETFVEEMQEGRQR